MIKPINTLLLIVSLTFISTYSKGENVLSFSSFFKVGGFPVQLDNVHFALSQSDTLTYIFKKVPYSLEDYFNKKTIKTLNEDYLITVEFFISNENVEVLHYGIARKEFLNNLKNKKEYNQFPNFSIPKEFSSFKNLNYNTNSLTPLIDNSIFFDTIEYYYNNFEDVSFYQFDNDLKTLLMLSTARKGRIRMPGGYRSICQISIHTKFTMKKYDCPFGYMPSQGFPYDNRFAFFWDDNNSRVINLLREYSDDGKERHAIFHIGFFEKNGNKNKEIKELKINHNSQNYTKSVKSHQVKNHNNEVPKALIKKVEQALFNSGN